jgi:hypothetical protein
VREGRRALSKGTLLLQYGSALLHVEDMRS